MKNKLQHVLLILGLTGLLVIGYGVANWIMFLNIVEAPLPEHEEKIPDFNFTEE